MIRKRPQFDAQENLFGGTADPAHDSFRFVGEGSVSLLAGHVKIGPQIPHLI